MLQVTALQKRMEEIEKMVAEATEQAAKPLSEVCSEPMREFVDSNKEWVQAAEKDLRDAKRRIGLAKGPKPKKARKSGDNDESNRSESD